MQTTNVGDADSPSISRSDSSGDADLGRAISRRVTMLYSWPFLPQEGLYRRVYCQAKTLVEAGYEVTLLAWDRTCRVPVNETIDGIHVKRIQIPAPFHHGPTLANVYRFGKFARAIKTYLRQNEFDVVHCFNIDTMQPGLLAAKQSGRKAVLDLCEPDYYRGCWKRRYSWLLVGVNWLEKTLAKRFDHLFVHNGYQVGKFHSYGITRMTQVGSWPSRSLVAESLRRPRSDLVVVGRLGTAFVNNGYEELVNAFQMLLRRRDDTGEGPTYKLRIAGNVYDSYRSAFDSLIEPLGDTVEVTGPYVEGDLRNLYREMDVSILLYGKKGFENITPTKLFDSMACGVPVVANAIGDVAKIVEEGNCGVIVDEKDPESICNGIERLAMDPDLRWKMANNAVRLAREKYTWEAVEDDFLAVYQELSCRTKSTCVNRK